ncbi:MAG: LysM peptidoglycan-binding domain-containing protein [Bacteroidota bacterium]
MTRFGFLFTLLIVALGTQWGMAQYTPDTTLTYATFLKECREFTQKQSKEVWVVIFWKSIDANSLDAIPQVKQIHDAFKHKPIRFISISTDRRRESWEVGMEEMKMPWEQMRLAEIEEYTYLRERAFRHNRLPAIFAVNPEGKIRLVKNTQELRSLLTLEATNLPDITSAPLASNNPGLPQDDFFVDDQPAGSSDDVVPVLEPTNQPGNQPSTQPSSKPAPPRETPPAATSGSGEWVTHTVRKGETLYSLFRRYNVAVDEIRRVNNIKNNLIREGQTLKIKRR